MLFTCITLTILCILLTIFSCGLYLNSEKAKKYIADRIESYNKHIDGWVSTANKIITERFDSLKKADADLGLRVLNTINDVNTRILELGFLIASMKKQLSALEKFIGGEYAAEGDKYIAVKKPKGKK